MTSHVFWINLASELTSTGELFRIEAQSMNATVGESNGHFDELVKNLESWELF